MVRTVLERSYVPGEYRISINNVGNDRIGYRFHLTRVGWPAGAIGTISVYMTLGGVQNLVRQVTLVGGDTLRRDGTPANFTQITGLWPGVTSGGNRTPIKPDDIEIAVTLLQSVTSAITIETT